MPAIINVFWLTLLQNMFIALQQGHHFLFNLLDITINSKADNTVAFLQPSNHPFDALKSSMFITFARFFAFSISIRPVTGTFAAHNLEKT
jgi:hypothetical protein